jgi:tRNA (mo5U34)-methyltransferase
MSSLRDRVEAMAWYHTIDLGDGVVARGYVDTRSCTAKLPFPPSLEGKRCLDVGTQNGFWAFELERRGAAEVVAVDLGEERDSDFPARARLTAAAGEGPENARAVARAGFELAREALGSQVQWRACSVYELSTEELGSFDFVFLGSLLLHLRDPVLALERVREVCRGEALFFDVFDPVATLTRRGPSARLDGQLNWWWTPNWQALRRMIESAGFDVVERSGLVFVPIGPAAKRPRLRRSQLLDPLAWMSVWRGSPQIGVRARPVEGRGT